MKKNNKRKGFTIVELVIVIAVIAILSAVLIPTFSGIVEKANTTAILQEARNMYVQYVAKNASSASIADVVVLQVKGSDTDDTNDDKYVVYKSGEMIEEVYSEIPSDYTDYTPVTPDDLVDETTTVAEEQTEDTAA